ncbi:hypothetical protein Vi05172_g113 [Venturia inaequalis]|nr:hypothetical protein Vi05172_g113 [Venturia inaequalis]
MVSLSSSTYVPPQVNLLATAGSNGVYYKWTTSNAD